MPLPPEQFLARARAAADGEGRLPPGGMSEWDTFPFEHDALRTVPLADPVLPEPPRSGEDPAQCRSCVRRDEGIWRHEHWRLTHDSDAGAPLVLMLHSRDHYDLPSLPDERAGELGRITVQLCRAMEALPHIARAHVYRIGDGAAHLHVFFFARPEGLLQLRGSNLVLWDDLLPAGPESVSTADARTVARSLADSFGGHVLP